jgi:di/tricarboxylate transporter
MTLAQGLAFAIVVVMMALFVWGRWRYDLVAAIALLAGVIVGIVPADQAFKGFSDDIVIIVGSALRGQRGGRALESSSGCALDWPYLTDINRQIVALVGSVTVLWPSSRCRAGHAHADRVPAGASERNSPSSC